MSIEPPNSTGVQPNGRNVDRLSKATTDSEFGSRLDRHGIVTRITGHGYIDASLTVEFRDGSGRYLGCAEIWMPDDDLRRFRIGQQVVVAVETGEVGRGNAWLGR